MTQQPGDRPHHTCNRCTSWWRGYNMAHCSVCHNTFGSVNSFDRHRVGGVCAPPDTIGLNYNTTRHCWSETYNGPRVTYTDAY